MNIAILGYGSQGASALTYWNTPDNAITVCDKNTELTLPDGVRAQLGASYLDELERFDLIVRSPSIHPRLIDASVLPKVTSNTNEFMRVCPSRNIIGVTGTKGKGTTSTIITRMLEASGRRVHLGGNIGTPPLEMLKENIAPDDWVVLELANFQLIDLQYSPHTAVCLMVEPEHLDWHTDINDYVRAKQQLFVHQASEDRAIFYAPNELSQKVVSASPGVHIPFFATPGALVQDNRIVIGDTDICAVSEIKLLGEHNWQNICAAITAVWPIIQDVKPIRETIKSMAGLPFRIELRTEINGVRFYNDSFATAPGATIAAIQAIPGAKILILGGHDRGLPLDELCDAIAQADDIRKIVAIGASSDRLVASLQEHGYTNIIQSDEKTMKPIVALAQSYAEPGDAVVLSPSFASFDMFKNFEERGRAFNAAVEDLS